MRAKKSRGREFSDEHGGREFSDEEEIGRTCAEDQFRRRRNVFILLLFTCLALYPFIYTVAGSFNDGIDFEYGGIWFFPRKFTLANYQAVFFDDRLYRAFLNTVVSTVAGVAADLYLRAASLTP